MKKIKILTPEEKLAKKRRAIMRERRPKRLKIAKPERKYDQWRDG
jgi:hypothetical protein